MTDDPIRKDNLVRLTVTIPEYIVDALKDYAQSGGFYRVSVSAVVTKACDEHLQKHHHLPKYVMEVISNP